MKCMIITSFYFFFIMLFFTLWCSPHENRIIDERHDKLCYNDGTCWKFTDKIPPKGVGFSDCGDVVHKCGILSSGIAGDTVEISPAICVTGIAKAWICDLGVELSCWCTANH